MINNSDVPLKSFLKSSGELNFVTYICALPIVIFHAAICTEFKREKVQLHKCVNVNERKKCRAMKVCLSCERHPSAHKFFLPDRCCTRGNMKIWHQTSYHPTRGRVAIRVPDMCSSLSYREIFLWDKIRRLGLVA